MIPPSNRLIGIVVAASVVVTAFHFTDNYVSIETYPQPDWIDGWVVLVSWPLFTVFGLAGWLLHRRGHLTAAHACLLAYSYTGLSSLGHLLSGSPDEFTTRGLISISADGAAGAAVLAVTIWSIVAHRAAAARPAGQSGSSANPARAGS